MILHKSLLKHAVLILVCYLAAVSFSITNSKLYPAKIKEDLKMLPDFQIMKFLALDHRGFLADLLFAEVNIHSGSLMWKPLSINFDSPWAFKAMDVITDLDPKYEVAYLFTGMGCIHDFDDVSLAEPILKKGMKNLPDNWQIPYWLGYDYFNYKQDFKTASKYFMIAAQKASAPKNFLAMLLSSSRKGGEYGKAVWAMQTMLENTDNQALKMIYQKKLVSLQNLAVLQEAANIYKNRFGHFPAHLNELIAKDLITEIPPDLSGKRYIWNQEKNLVTLETQQTK